MAAVFVYRKQHNYKAGEVMSRQRSQERDKAWEIFKKHNGKIALTSIAEQLALPEGTVRGWKAKDNWTKKLNGTFQSNNAERSRKNMESIIPKKTNIKRRGAPIGNKNAAGNKGGPGGPVRNKHAIKTHEYATIFFTADIIDDEERNILDADYDKYVQQIILIDTLKIREKRIMQEIRKVKNTPGGMVFESVTKQKGTNTTSFTKRNKKGDTWDGDTEAQSIDTSTHAAQPELLLRMKLEESLTRTQTRLQKAIEVWHRMEIDDENLAQAQKKLDLYRQRLTGQYDLDELLGDDELSPEFF